MADFIEFDAGANYLEDSGWPSTVYFLLSTKACSGVGGLVVGDTLGGGVGEITGTGYTRQSQAEPAAASRSKTFSQMTFDTGTATDWPAGVKSVVAATTSDNTGVALCAWNLQAGGTARDMSAAHTQEKVTPVYTN